MSDFFHILGINQDADEETIKSAYRACLPKYNPEDDEQGFKRLRAAYEEALAYVRKNAGGKTADAEREAGGRKSEADAKNTDGTEDTRRRLAYLDDVAVVYYSFSRRMNADEWRRVLSNSIYRDLDEGAQAKKELLSYLTTHWQFPAVIYRVIDEQIGIADCEAELREYLPEGFVDFCLSRIADQTGDGDFPYEWLAGDDHADYDGFVQGLIRLMKLTVDEQWEEAAQCEESLRQFGITHPYYGMEQAKLLLHEGKKEEACALARALIEKSKDSVRTRGNCAEVLWEAGLHEEAFQTFYAIHEQYEQYEAEKYLCYYYGEKDDLLRALEHGRAALQQMLKKEFSVYARQVGADGQKTEFGRYLDGLYRRLLERCGDKPVKDTAGLQWMLRAFAQLKMPQEGLIFLENNADAAAKLRESDRYRSIFCQCAKRYDESLEAIHRYQARLEADEHKKRAAAYSIETETLGLKGSHKEALKAIEQALALDGENDRYQWQQLTLLMRLGMYEEAVGTADKILQKNPGWVSVLTAKQAACYRIGDAQEAVNLYAAGVKLAPEEPQFYEIAAKVFLDYEQLADADKVLEAAKEAGVESAGLVCAYIRSLRKKKEAYEIIKEIRSLAAEQEKAYQAIPEPSMADKETMAAIYAELSYACYDAGDPFQQPVEDRINMQKAIALAPLAGYYFAYGRMLLADKEQDLAMEQFAEAKARCLEKTPWLYASICECMGYVYECRRQQKKAIACYKEGLEHYPSHAALPGKIANLYSDMLHHTGSLYFAKDALAYAGMQLERDTAKGRYHTLLVRCQNYLLMRCYDKALEDAKELLRIKTLDVDGLYYQGKAYLGLNRLPEALASFRDAAEMMEGGNMLLAVYRYAGRTLERLLQYEEAEEWYKKGRDWNPNAPDFYFRLKTLYLKTGDYEKAKNMLHRIDHNTHLHFQLAQLRVDLLQCNASLETPEEKEEKRTQILLQMKEIARKAPEVIQKSLRVTNPITAWSEIGDIYLFYLGDYKQAKEMYLRAQKEAKSKWDARQVNLCLMYLYAQKKDAGNVKKYGEEFMAALKEYYTFDPETEDTPCEQFEKSLLGHTQKLAQLAMYWYCMGNMEQAERYQKMIDEYIDDMEDAYAANQYNPMSELFIGREAGGNHDCRN